MAVIGLIFGFGPISGIGPSPQLIFADEEPSELTGFDETEPDTEPDPEAEPEPEPAAEPEPEPVAE